MSVSPIARCQRRDHPRLDYFPRITEGKRVETERELLSRELVEREDRLRRLMEQVLLRNDEARRNAVAPELGRLSAREQHVMPLVAKGKTNPEIGQALGCSTPTARKHVQTMLAKLG